MGLDMKVMPVDVPIRIILLPNFHTLKGTIEFRYHCAYRVYVPLNF